MTQFEAAVSAVKQAMRDGSLCAEDGLAEVRKLLVRQLRDSGLGERR